MDLMARTRNTTAQTQPGGGTSMPAGPEFNWNCVAFEGMDSQCHTKFMVFSDPVLVFSDEVSLQCKDTFCVIFPVQSAISRPSPEFCTPPPAKASLSCWGFLFSPNLIFYSVFSPQHQTASLVRRTSSSPPQSAHLGPLPADFVAKRLHSSACQEKGFNRLQSMPTGRHMH